MPAFLKDLSLRRRSRTSHKTVETGGSSGSSSNNGDAPERIQKNRSTSTLSTLSTWLDRSSPPTTVSSEKSKSSSHLPIATSNGDSTPPIPRNTRPRVTSSYSNRYSLVGMSPQNGEQPPIPPQPRSIPATSPFAPRVLSVSDGSWVHQKVLLIF